jgi:hypothetical protein
VYPSPDIIKDKSASDIWAEHVAGMGETSNSYEVLVHLEDLDVDGPVIAKPMLNR